MSVLTQRGGVPRIQRETVDATGRRYLPGGVQVDPAVGQYRFVTQHLQIYNVGINPIKVYFLEEDFTADTNFLSIASGGSWEGPIEIDALWLKSPLTTTVELVAYQRRG